MVETIRKSCLQNVFWQVYPSASRHVAGRCCKLGKIPGNPWLSPETLAGASGYRAGSDGGDVNQDHGMT